MSVRKRRRKDPATGKVSVVFMVDIDFEHASGKRTRVRKVSPVQTKRGAEAYEVQVRFELLHGTYRAEEKEVKAAPTLQEFAPQFMNGYAKANRQKPSTIAGKQAILDTYLLPKLGTTRLDALDDRAVQLLKAGFPKLAPKTVNNILSVLLTLLKTAVAWKVIATRPEVKLLRIPKTEVGFYEPEEYERLVEAGRNLDPRIELLVLLGGDAGLRCGEIIALEWTDIDVKRRMVKVQRSEWIGEVTAPKSGRSRQVKMTERLTSALAAHRHLKGPRVLCRDGGDRVTREVLSGWMRKVQRRANVRDTGALHILRHTFCSRLAMLGAPTMAIKELAGHQDISTTQKYMHLSPAAQDSAIKLLDEAHAAGPGNAEGSEVTAP